MPDAEIELPCPCWANTHALGHGGHCCFVQGDRRINNGFKDDEAICHVREGVKIANGINTPPAQTGSPS